MVNSIYYKKDINGRVSDVQRKANPGVDDILYEGEEMPDIETLHDASYITARDAALVKVEADKQQRLDDIVAILPDMATVNARVDSLTSIPALREAVRDLHILINWVIKGTSD